MNTRSKFAGKACTFPAGDVALLAPLSSDRAQPGTGRSGSAVAACGPTVGVHATGGPTRLAVHGSPSRPRGGTLPAV